MSLPRCFDYQNKQRLTNNLVARRLLLYFGNMRATCHVATCPVLTATIRALFYMSVDQRVLVHLIVNV
jgi:hypothetical protein